MQSIPPMHAAAIDVGSNAIRIIVASYRPGESYCVVAKNRYPVRLGASVFQIGYIDAATQDAAIQSLRLARDLVSQFTPCRIRAVATSAVRESRNGNAFISEVRSTTGIPLELISGTEEARLVSLAVLKPRRSIEPSLPNRFYLVDLGGGSLEIACIENGKLLWSESHPIGALRYRYLMGDSPLNLKALYDDLERHLLRSKIKNGRSAICVGVGGNMESLQALTRDEQKPYSDTRLSSARLSELAITLSGMTLNERIERFGLSQDRAEVIVPAAIIFEWLAKQIGADAFIVPGVGVKDGLLIEACDTQIF